MAESPEVAAPTLPDPKPSGKPSPIHISTEVNGTPHPHSSPTSPKESAIETSVSVPAIAAPALASPADLVPPATRLERLAWYAGTILLTVLLISAGYRLDQVDITAPFFYDGDALLILPMVKATLERGSHWQNERMGYPGICQLYDFPVVDHLHFGAIWLLGRVFSSAVVVFNLYYLLTYPITAFTTMLALRYLRLTLPAAAVGGVLYAFLPYHYLRGEAHYFLAAYWMVPLSLLPALFMCRGDAPFFRREPDGRYRFHFWRWSSLAYILLGVATASAGAYYAYFACAIYAAAGAYAWAATRAYRVALSAVVLIGIVFIAGVANHFPTFVYQYEFGRNSSPHTRYAEEAELYGLRIIQLVMPIDDHNLTAVARIKSAYNSSMRADLSPDNERAFAVLGIVGSAGLIGLLTLLLLPARKTWPYGPLAALTAFMLLVSTTGGFGAVFNHLFSPQVRCYNRISVYLGFLCLFAVLWFLDQFLVTRVGWARKLRYPALAGLLLLGFFDQTPHRWFDQAPNSFYYPWFPKTEMVKSIEREAKRYQEDAEFFEQVEQAMPAGSRIFTLPYIPYPESPPMEKMGTYDPARGYLHTRTLVWSYGAIKGREIDAWQRTVSRDTPAEMLRRIVARGFDGLFVDARAYTGIAAKNGGHKLIDEIEHLARNLDPKTVQVPRIVHKDGNQVFLDLTQYRKALERQSPEQYEDWAKQEREWATVIWLHGIYCHEPLGDEDKLRWCSRSGSAVLINPSERTRKFQIEMTFGVDDKGEFGVTLAAPTLTLADGSALTDSFTLEKKTGSWDSPVKDYGPRKVYTVSVPPGRHTIHFACQTPEKFMPSDGRALCFFIKDFKMTELK